MRSRRQPHGDARDRLDGDGDAERRRALHHRDGAAGERHVEAGPVGRAVEGDEQHADLPDPVRDLGLAAGVVVPGVPGRVAAAGAAEGHRAREGPGAQFLFGRKSATTPGATEDRTTGGILSFITTNQTDAGGDLSEAEFNAFMLQVMRYGSDSKLAIASGSASRR
jgi:hypothetical protein